MDLASWVILFVIIIWFIWACSRIVRNRGGCSCGCGKTATNGNPNSCCGNCTTCEKCNHE